MLWTSKWERGVKIGLTVGLGVLLAIGAATGGGDRKLETADRSDRPTPTTNKAEESPTTEGEPAPTEPPATDAPATEPPATEPPVTEPPTTDTLDPGSVFLVALSTSLDTASPTLAGADPADMRELATAMCGVLTDQAPDYQGALLAMDLVARDNGMTTSDVGLLVGAATVEGSVCPEHLAGVQEALGI